MKIRKNVLGVGASTLAVAVLLTGCLSAGAVKSSAGTQDGAAAQSETVTQEAVLTQTTAAAAAGTEETPESGMTLTFTDSGVTASGSEGGYEIEGTALTITDAGVYTLTGSCADGSVSVKKGVTDVTLILDGLTLTNTSGAAICGGKESGVTIWLAGASSLTDAEDPADENSTDAEVADAFEGAALKIKADGSLTITGSGSLTINANAKNGIKGGDGATVTIESGTLAITAVNDAIASSGDLTVTGGTLTIDAGDDALHADGTLTIGAEHAAEGPAIDVRSCCEGFEGARVILNAGTGSILSSDDGINAASDETNDVGITVNGGVWYVNADGDGLDAGGENNRGSGSIVLNGGTVTVYGAANTGNGALDSESGITYNGGTLLAIGMSGMAEAPSGGSVLVFGSVMGGGMGRGQGDRPQDGQQPPQDGQQFPQDGQQPPQRPDEQQGQQPPQRPDGQQQGPGGRQDDRQGDVTIRAGSTIVITDSSGAVVCETLGVKDANSVVFASASIIEGETYTLTVDGEVIATAVAGEVGTQGFGGFGGWGPPSGGMPGQ